MMLLATKKKSESLAPGGFFWQAIFDKQLRVRNNRRGARVVPHAPPTGQSNVELFWAVFLCRFRILMLPKNIPWQKWPKWPKTPKIGVKAVKM